MSGGSTLEGVSPGTNERVSRVNLSNSLSWIAGAGVMVLNKRLPGGGILNAMLAVLRACHERCHNTT